ncbi:MAG: inorganic phosphate transporter [Bacteroidota bacterium]
MENIYLVIVFILFALAISDLVVGVSNDAVNFLNSAIGSKAASFRVVMIVAAIGVLVGATFSEGMMEVARKGIFHPDNFYFSEIMIIFVAVMITDVLLLDLFNTFGLPTSTTVSIVFELLGAAVAVAVIKIVNNPNALGMEEYINTGKALAIISGILLSVVISFSVGALIQWITRLIFTFDFKKKMRYFGAVWGGIAITAITYFMLIKGAKGASFLSDETVELVTSNTWLILGVCFVGWTLLLQVLLWLFRLNILKMIVLVGTFALAMAFAGNDLVNFIGVPLAGFESYKAWAANPGADPGMFSMESLSGKVQTDTYMLIIAGLVMVATLWLSRKARGVIKTSVDLSRQNEGDERFGSSFLARSIVRISRTMGEGAGKVFPGTFKQKLNSRFDQRAYRESLKGVDDAPAFDMVRASVNLVVASILIAIGTSLKLPLSTTYVTFMVAMGTSLSDKAWGRESAVYRITGVLSVIGGWFLTALVAFTTAFIIALIINWGGLIAIIVLLVFAIFFVIRTRIIYKKREEAQDKGKEFSLDYEIKSDNIQKKCTSNVIETLGRVKDIYAQAINGLVNEDRKQLKELSKSVDNINSETKRLKSTIHLTIKKLEEDAVETGPYYVQVLDYLRETAHCLTYITRPGFEHFANNHSGFSPAQTEELNDVRNDVISFIEYMLEMMQTSKYRDLDEVLAQQQAILRKIEEYRKKQLKRIKGSETGTRISMLYLNVYHETKNLLLYGVNLLKAQRDFTMVKKSE